MPVIATTGLKDGQQVVKKGHCRRTAANDGNFRPGVKIVITTKVVPTFVYVPDAGFMPGDINNGVFVFRFWHGLKGVISVGPHKVNDHLAGANLRIIRRTIQHKRRCRFFCQCSGCEFDDRADS
ncbi:hypothetical protein D3C86_1820460 [compost metagenome]